MKNLHLASSAGFVFLFPVGILTPHLCFISNLIGIFRKAGLPKMNMAYLQSVVFLEEFCNITYLISIFMTRGGLMVYSPLLISAVLVLAIEFNKLLTANPSFPLLSAANVKDWIQKGAQP